MKSAKIELAAVVSTLLEDMGFLDGVHINTFEIKEDNIFGEFKAYVDEKYRKFYFSIDNKNNVVENFSWYEINE